MNPTVRRLEKVARKYTLRLTHYGRKSGKPYDVTIWFVVDGDRIAVGTANINRQWVRNVQKTSAVDVSIGDQKFSGIARFLSDRADHERVQALMFRKYWMFWPILTLGQILMGLKLLADRSGSFEITLSESQK